ncbi:MAG: ABC transporter ATP-binding protein [Cyanobacteria bacterium P01_D01_bin.73]
MTVDSLYFSWSPAQPVLKDCSLEIPSGELWMLLGANGSGKSTLLQLLAGLLRPSSGKVQLRQPVGFVFQNPDRQLVMPTVGADVAFGLAKDNLSQVEIRDRVRDALSEVGLDGLERRPIYALSGGQKQRVAIAGAIATHCDVLLLDEPTALLDPDSQLDLVRQVRSLVEQRGLTALWVTHRLEELQFAHGAILLEQGKVVDSGDPERLRKAMVERPYPAGN